MTLSDGRYARVGQAGCVYLTVAGVRLRATVHSFGSKGPELSISLDPLWTEENRVNALDIIEVRATPGQAAIRVRGMDGG
jgi:hypothetical protein